MDLHLGPPQPSNKLDLIKKYKKTKLRLTFRFFWGWCTAMNSKTLSNVSTFQPSGVHVALFAIWIGSYLDWASMLLILNDLRWSGPFLLNWSIKWRRNDVDLMKCLTLPHVRKVMKSRIWSGKCGIQQIIFLLDLVHKIPN